MREIGARAIAVSTNITDTDACARLMAAGAEEFGGIDVLVNNAFRMDVFQTFEEVDLAIWRKIMDVNLFGSLQMTRAALPFMRQRGGGSVVMVASMVARQPQPLQGGYAISKGALLTATRVLAYELGPSKVRVNAVVPGWMAGPSVDIYIDMGRPAAVCPPSRWWTSSTPGCRWATSRATRTSPAPSSTWLRTCRRP